MPPLREFYEKERHARCRKFSFHWFLSINPPMGICALSEREADVLQNNGKEPCCDDHTHITGKEAKILIANQGGLWISGCPTPSDPFGRRRRFIRLKYRFWRVRNMAMQLLPGDIIGRNSCRMSAYGIDAGPGARGFRFPIPACGGHDRRTSVKAINYVPAKPIGGNDATSQGS